LLALCYGFGFFLCSSVFQFSFPALQHSLFWCPLLVQDDVAIRKYMFHFICWYFQLRRTLNNLCMLTWSFMLFQLSTIIA
jgi:hypothetical protein